MAITTANVRFWHDLKEGTGTSIADENGGGAGTMTATQPTWSTTGPTGISTNCVLWDGGTDHDRIDTASSSAAQVAFALCVWFWHAGSASTKHMVAGDSVTGGTHVPRIFKDSSDRINATLVNPGVGDDFTIVSAIDSGDSAWHLAIFQRDSSGNAELFIDGTSRGTATNTTALSSRTFNIGNALDADGSNDFNWGGKLSQVVLFDAPLDSGERAKLYNAGAGTTYSSFFASAVSTTSRHRMLTGIGS